MTTNTSKKLNLKKRGQGMTEYIIIVALIAIAAIGVVSTFGNNIKRVFDSASSALGGNANQSNMASGQVDTGEEKADMADFGEKGAGK